MIWESSTPPPHSQMSPFGWIIVLFRAIPIGLIVSLGLCLTLVLRLLEYPLFGQTRPITPYITQAVCRLSLVLIGLDYRVEGHPMRQGGGIVANHCSWIDIFALNSFQRVYFVSKSEVASWPFIGQLAKATGTVFIERNPAKAAEQRELFTMRLQAGHKLLFFPEGTSTDGQQVLSFKPTLFAAYFDPELRDRTFMQAVSLHYLAPEGKDARFYCWWGDMSFAAHLITTLSCLEQGRVVIRFCDPVAVSDFKDRKALAAALQASVAEAHTQSMKGA